MIHRFSQSVSQNTVNNGLEKFIGKRIMSGIQPTGDAHLGNYLGAIQNWVNLSKVCATTEKKMILSIVDLHALTIPPKNSDTFRSNCYKMAATILGCGIPADKALVYWQSHVPQHTQLMWLLACHTPMGGLFRMPQYREKSESSGGSHVGLFSYPVLQAADILLFKGECVPVGEDQSTHLHFTRDLVSKINSFYDKTVFPKPDMLLQSDCARVMSLREPTKKMSKSEKSVMSRIDLIDNRDTLFRKISKAVTDSSGPNVSYDSENRKGLANLIRIYAALSGESIESVVDQFSDSNTKQFKEACAETVDTFLSPIRSEILRLMKEKKYLRQLMQQNAAEATQIAHETMMSVQKDFGLIAK